MFMQRRLCLRSRDNGVCRFREMVVPVHMRRTTAVPMNMDVTRKHGCIAPERCIQRVVGRLGCVIMRMAMVVIVAVNVIMLDELRLKNVRLATMFDRDDDVEFVRLGNLLDGFPVSPVICEEKDLALPAGAQCLDPDGVSGDAGRTEPRRNA